MKKLFTLTLALLASFSLSWAADFTIDDIDGKKSSGNITCSATAAKISNGNVCREAGGGYDSGDAIPISGAANGSPNTNYIEIHAAANYYLQSPVTITGVIANNSDKKICAVLWEGDANTTSCTSFQVLTAKNRKTACNETSLDIAFTGDIRTIRIYTKIYINNNNEFISSSSSSTNRGDGTNYHLTEISATASAKCNPIGVASTGTATSVTYNSASLPFTMDKTTGVSSLIIEVFKNSDDSKVATYSNITPATSGSQAATELSESTTYYYKITTVSDGGDYCEGETTAKSATFTTTAAPVANPEITGAVNEDGWGTVAPASITVTSGDELSIAGNVITCGGKTLTATASEATDEYTYAFDSWSGVTNGQSVTTNLTATANFTRTPNTYDVNYTAPTNGNYTIKVGEESAVSENTTAAYGQTVTLAATPNSGYKLGSWSVYKTDDDKTKVTVTNNQFTMPAYDVTISATFVEATILYDCSVMTANDKWLSFTGEEVTAAATGKSKTFGTSGYPQLIVEDGGWDKKDNIINSFIKLFGNTTTKMSIVIPANKLATVTIKYGSYSKDNKYLLVNGVAQTKPQQNMVDNITAENYESYLGVVELTEQSGSLVLNSNASGQNIYIAYVDVAITGTVIPTALDNTEAGAKAVKSLKNGMLIIEKNGKKYNVIGSEIR